MKEITCLKKVCICIFFIAYVFKGDIKQYFRGTEKGKEGP